MLPYIKPVHVRKCFQEDAESISTYTDAVRTAIEKLNINQNDRNIMITHQFVMGAERAESEEISVGGSDNVDVSVFDCFDYTALGHLHRPQNCKSEKVRYCGTPLKYSFSEAKDQKSVTVLELKQKGELNVRTVPLIPQHDMVEIRGKYEEIINRNFYKDTNYQEDYMHITLTDEDDVYDAVSKLRTVYHNLMKLDYDNTRTRHNNTISGADDVENKTPLELFAELYELQNNEVMSEEQSQLVQKLIDEVWEDEI